MNRLAKEKSPYLLQHKDNPVDWYSWGIEAFEAARKENRPIFLSIGYSTCYWCHMMEKDSFEHQEVADILNPNFICIKVDREEHPDVDQVYMDAVVGMTGQGGWPLNLFLTPDLKPFFGGTFFWKAEFMQLLSNIATLWKKEPQKFLEAGEQLVTFLNTKRESASSSLSNEELFQKAFQQMEQNFDERYGGFGDAPKFPHSTNLLLLLNIHQRSGDPKALSMVTKTLDAMAQGGIYDHIGGGFHRYSTDEQWQVPHFEKMLYDNALLAWTYLEAYQLTKNKAYATITREVFNYILREMTDPQGGFYSAQDAGEVGKEGEYYALGREDRNKATPPHKDDKILTSWNGLMIAALAKGHQILKEEAYLKAAQKCAKFIEKNLYKEGKLLRRFRSGDAKLEGLLDDYAFLIHGLLSIFESDCNVIWIDWARKLQAQQDKQFWDEKEGGYFFANPHDTILPANKKNFHDGATPSGNAISALNLLKLYALTQESSYQTKADLLVSLLTQQPSEQLFALPTSLLSIDAKENPQKLQTHCTLVM